ncbi:hypothetical protein [Gordonia sp. NPDC003585]|uniref:hypothetical protein n=1 Tax=Gordonia sp. NPDC003585 TaxID=3154275 RepID=UPI0033BF536D
MPATTAMTMTTTVAMAIPPTMSAVDPLFLGGPLWGATGQAGPLGGHPGPLGGWFGGPYAP